jgi:hypothetical protein
MKMLIYTEMHRKENADRTWLNIKHETANQKLCYDHRIEKSGYTFR